jgi:hypothetical protein
MPKIPTREEQDELLMVALRSGCEPNFNVILGSVHGAFQMRYEPQPELVRLLKANRERFIALLDKPVIVAADWGFGANYATFRVVPVGGSEQGSKFVTFTLPIPPDKPYAILQ